MDGRGVVKRRALCIVGIQLAIPYSSNNKKQHKSYLKRVRIRKLKKSRTKDTFSIS